jgi:hypothetical protein
MIHNGVRRLLRRGGLAAEDEASGPGDGSPPQLQYYDCPVAGVRTGGAVRPG